MNAGLRLYSSTPFTGKTMVEKVAGAIFMVLVGISVLCGAYTTIVFALVDVYSKIALSYGLTENYENFILATSKVRQMGYKNFLVCLESFAVSFGISLTMKTPKWARWPMLIAVFGAILVSSRHVSLTVGLAEKHIGKALNSNNPFMNRLPDGLHD
mmetsp:Transcript_22804/g.31858  ORF Transcript_22804/g.31858 Transcript_22804/m.31858 type:complete len:156 (-) Transcript_22804:48-515(-)